MLACTTRVRFGMKALLAAGEQRAAGGEAAHALLQKPLAATPAIDDQHLHLMIS